MAELSFIILKVNGIDVKQLPKNESVQMFLTAGNDEPLLFEVRPKKISGSNTTASDVSAPAQLSAKLEELKIATTVTADCQHDPASELLLTLRLAQNAGIPSTTTNAKNTSTPKTSKSTQTDEHFFVKAAAERLIEQEHNLFEQCLAPEIDIEEITLRKSGSNERLGLIVCYSGCSNNGSGNNNNNNNGALSGSDDNELCTEVYISDIQPDSVAGRDGRLRQGDQILQINGKDIKNKEETESLIAENNNAVTLLVSRYLYADEDDFNDPSVAELDVEDEDDDDDEEVEFYDDNNLAYENCFLPNEYMNVVDELDKVLLAQVAQQATTFAAQSGTGNQTVLNDTAADDDARGTVQAKHAAAKGHSSRADGEQPSEHQVLSSRQLLTPAGRKEGAPPKALNAATLSSTSSSSIAAYAPSRLNAPPAHTDYETEHIYETIPEDSESEPFYCSPYESATYVTAVGSCSSSNAVDAMHLQQQQKQRVAQWLGLRAAGPSAVAPTNANATTTSATTALRQSMRSSSGCGRSIAHFDGTSAARQNKSGTVRSSVTTATNGSSNSGGGLVLFCSNNNVSDVLNDEHDNSSSAYNTGGSNNSNAPLILMLNQGGRGDVLSCAMEDEAHAVVMARASNVKAQRLQSPKDKITSPKHSGVGLGKGVGNATAASGAGAAASVLVQTLRGNADAPPTLVRMFPSAEMQQQKQFSPKTMYTNEANLYQTMLLQQHLYRQAMTQQQQPHHADQVLQQQQQLHCPQFTAPNLSQYHFVSSQEVSAAHSSGAQPAGGAMLVTHKSAPNEEAMVWKVKRRPDGTRYIVRRPARNRCVLRDRSVRLSMERVRNNEINTTTEEETISEVKTGRYWSKEERKKHIERARERRHQQQQQQQQQQQMLESGTAARNFMSTMRISDRTALKLQQQQKREQCLQQFQQQQQQLQQHLQLQQQQQTQQRPRRSLQQQHYQLQFNSATVPATTPMTANTNTVQQQAAAAAPQQHSSAPEMAPIASIADIAANASGGGNFLPLRNNTNSYDPNAHICSPVAADSTATTAPTHSATLGAGSELAYEANTNVVVGATAGGTAAAVNYPAASEASKLQNLLSVTTV